MATLRDNFFTRPEASKVSQKFENDLEVSGMNSLSRGWEAGRIGNEANTLSAEELNVRAAGDVAGADEMRKRIAGLQLRQGAYAPAVGRVEDINSVGDAGSWAAGQVGQGAASMVDPIAASVALNAAGRVLPGVAGKVAQGAALAVPYFMNQRQLTGEFGNSAYQDPELIARTSPTQLRDSANIYGGVAGLADTVLPGVVGRQVSGASRAGSAAARSATMNPLAKTGLGMLGEGATETAQSMGSQYTQGLLNPNRNTSGDFSENLNSFAGGAVGAGPFTAAGAYAEAGHNRVDASVDAVKGAAGDVVDLMNESPTVQAAKEKGKDFWNFAKRKTGETVDLAQQKATDFATGEDGSVSVANAVNNATEQAQGAMARVRGSKADLDALSAASPAGLNAAQQLAWLDKNEATQRAVAQRMLAERNDPVSQQLLADLNDPNNPDAVGAAADHLLDNTRLAPLSETVGEAMAAAASWGGSKAGGAAKGAAALAVKFGKGVMQGLSKKNMQSELDLNSMEGSDPGSPYDNWLLRTTRNRQTLGDEALAQIHTRKGMMAEQAKEDSYRRAVMAGEYLAKAAKQNTPQAQPELVDFMRTVGFEINDIADSWGMANMPKPDATAMQRQKVGLSLNLDRIAESLNEALGSMAGDALTHLEKTADPKSAPMFEFLREKVMQGETPAGRAAREADRAAAVNQMVHLLPRDHFNTLMKNEGAAEELFHGFEMMSRGHAVKGSREIIDAELGADTVNKIMNLVSGLAFDGQPEEQMSEGVSDFDQAAAQKKMDKGGSAMYLFGNRTAPRTAADMFSRTDKPKGQSDQDQALAGEDITRRPRLFKGTTDPKTGAVAGTDMMPKGGTMLDFKIKEMEDHVGYVRGETGPGEEPGWNDTHKGYGVDTITAHEAMKGMTLGRVLSLYRDYLRQDSAPGEGKKATDEQTEAGRKATAVGMLLGRLISNAQKPAGDPSQWTEQQSQEWKKALKLAKETGHTGEGPAFESMEVLNDHQSQVALKEAEDYFRNHHIVRAYSMTDNDPQVLNLELAAKLQKKGKKVDDAVRLDAARASDDEAADQIRSDANLLYFPKDGKDVPIAASDLVLWAKKTEDFRGQSKADDEVSHTSGAENKRYLEALIHGIGAYADAHADGMPYKINPGGEQEFFQESRKGKIDGVPDSLRLQNKSYAESASAGELDAKFKSPLTPKRHISRVGPNRLETADIRRRASNQAGVIKDSMKQEEPFTAEPLESVAAQPGGVYVPTSQNEREAAEKLADRLYKENPDTWMEEYKRLAPYPSSSAQFYQPNADVGTESTSKGAAGDDVVRTGRMPANRSGKAPHEAKTDDSDKTEIDFSKGQDPKAEADEITNQKWFTQQTMEKYVAPTTAMRGMSSAKHNAAGLLRTMMDDPRAGDREAITMLRTALIPLDGASAKGKTFEAYRVAPLIHLVSNNHETEGEGFRALTNAQYFENAGATPELTNIIRRGAAQVLLTKSNMSDAHRLTLARQLTGNTSLQHNKVTPALKAFLKDQGGDVTREDMAVNWGDPSTFPATEKMKVQPAPHVAPPTTIKQKVAAKAAAAPVTAASAQAEFDSVLADMEKDGAFAAKPAAKPYAESASAQAAIDRVRTAPDAAELARRTRNATKPAAVDPKVAALQAEVARLQAMVTGTPAAAPKVAAPESYVVKAPSADLQSKIDVALPKMDGTYLSAIKAAITRNEMWVASGDAGPNVAKVDIPNLKKWATMGEAEAKAAVEANNSPNMGRVVKTLQAGSTGSPLGKPGGVKNKQAPDTAEATPAQMAEAKAWLDKVAPGTVLKFIKESGYSGEFIEADNLINVSTTAAAGIMGTTYHEGLHKFFAQFVKSNPKLRKMFESFANDKRVVDRLLELLKDYPEAQAQLLDGEERLAYAFQFWKAGLLRVDNENKSFMQKISGLFRRVLGMVRDSEHALAIFQAFDQGKLAEPSVAAKAIDAQLKKGSMALRARRGLDGLTQGLAAAVLPAETILGQNQYSQTARKLSKILFTNPGDEESGGGQVGYLNAKRSASKRWMNQANSVFEKMEKGDIDAVQKHMQAQTNPADIKLAPHRGAVVSLRKTLEEFHTYMKDSGLKIGKVDKYYPTVWSVDALQKNKSEFIKMLVNKYAQQMNPEGGNAHKAAERIWSALIDRNGVDAKALNATRDAADPNAPKAALREDGVLSPFFAGKEQQTLWWLEGADKEAYLNKNMTHTLSQYFHQGVRAAEYHIRFGENGIKLEVALKKIREELTTASNKLMSEGEIKNDADRVKWLARQTRDVSMAVGAIEGTLGKDITPNMRKFNSYMIAYQNIRLLPYMIFSSFVDPLAQVARGAPVSAALETFTYGMREVFRAWADMFRDMPKERQKDEWTKLAEHIGSIEVAMFNHHAAEDYSSVYMSPLARKVNEKLFQMNGMEAWDRANRTMATKWAVRFIEQHRGLPDKAHSQRWLSELGLTPATIPVNADGQLITSAEELAVVKGITIEDAKQRIVPIHAALNRWVEGAVISPNAAQRPGWSSDPNYAAVFHLKQFAYSFQQTIMKRALKEIDHGNLRPITTLVGFVPTMLCADLIKGLIQGGGSLPPYMAGMDAGDRILYAIQRSGIMGTGDIAVNAMEDWSSLGGPAFEQVVDGLKDDIGRTSVNALPLHSMGEYLFSGGKQGIVGPT